MSGRENQSDIFLESEAVNNDLFVGIVENALKIKRDQFKVRLVLLSPAAGNNENFTSVLFRTKIKILLNDGKKETVQVVMKVLLTLMQEMKEFSVFRRERLMYEDVIASFEKVWLDAGEEIQFGPK